MSRVKNPDGTWTDAPPLSLEAHGTGPVTVIRPKAPTARQQEVWDAVQRLGTQMAAARELGVAQGSVQTHLRAYMAAKGIAGPLPGYSKGAYGAPRNGAKPKAPTEPGSPPKAKPKEWEALVDGQWVPHKSVPTDVKVQQMRPAANGAGASIASREPTPGPVVKPGADHSADIPETHDRPVSVPVSDPSPEVAPTPPSTGVSNAAPPEPRGDSSGNTVDLDRRLRSVELNVADHEQTIDRLTGTHSDTVVTSTLEVVDAYRVEDDQAYRLGERTGRMEMALWAISVMAETTNPSTATTERIRRVAQRAMEPVP